MDIKAAKTVIITIMAFAVCYVPNVCIGIWILFNSEKFVMYVSWPGQVFHLACSYPVRSILLSIASDSEGFAAH